VQPPKVTELIRGSAHAAPAPSAPAPPAWRLKATPPAADQNGR